MTFSGLRLPLLLGLFLLSLLIIVLLYRLRDRRPVTVVASLELYRELLEHHPSPRRSLRKLLSIAIQVILVTLLLAALSEPHREIQTAHQRHILVLFDNSASMQATEGASTRFELGQQLLLQFIESLTPESQVLLATANVVLTPQLPWTSDRALLRDATRKLTALPLPSQFQACLENAVSYLAGKTEAELLLVTDGAASAFQSVTLPKALSKTKIHVLRVGIRKDNVAFLGFSPRRRIASLADTELLISLGNFGNTQRRFTVDIFADEQLVHSQKWSLLASETKRRTQLLTLGQAHRLRAKIRFEPGQTDALALDNEAYAWLGSPHRSRLLVRTAGNLYLEAAVLSDSSVTPSFISPDAPEPTTPIDAVILDGGPLLRPLKHPTLWLNPPPDSPFVAQGKPLQNIGFDTWARQHPMLTGLELFDVQVATARKLASGPGDQVLAKSGNSPLLIETKIDNVPLIILGFDPKKSDFVLRPVWPLFIEQVTTHLMGTENVRGTAARSGEPVTLTLLHPNSPRQTERRIVSPNGQVQQVTTNHGQLTLVPDQLGFYEVLAENESTQTDWFAVNLFAEIESRILPNSEITFDAQPLPTPKLEPVPEQLPLSLWLVFATLVLLVLEWVGFHRRVVV